MSTRNPIFIRTEVQKTFDHQNILIGHQCIFYEAPVTGTRESKWLHLELTNQHVEFDVIIFFPWDLEKEEFLGEWVFVFGLEQKFS